MNVRCPEGWETNRYSNVDEKPGTNKPIAFVHAMTLVIIFGPAQGGRDEKGLTEGKAYEKRSWDHDGKNWTLETLDHSP